MKTDIQKLYSVWEQTHVPSPKSVDLRQIEFSQLISSIYSAGPSYYYVIDFYDMSVSHVSPAVKEIHGLDPNTANFNDILSLIHPEDMDHVAKAEAKLIDIFQNKVGVQKFTKYKTCYCFRFQTVNGYKLFLHQALVLTIDENGGVSKALNIHTDISHLTSVNNYTVSFIGLQGEPSYMEIELAEVADSPKPSCFMFTKREVEIIRLLAEGLTSAAIAEKLHIAIDTAKNHRRNILQKAGVKNSIDLIRKCMVDGLI